MKRGPLALVVLLLLLGAAGLWWTSHTRTSRAFVSGTLEGQEYLLRVPLALQVIRVPVQEGQEVRPGDTLVVLDTLGLHAQMAALRAQERALQHQQAAARIQLQQYQRDLQRLHRLQGQAVPVQQLEDLQAKLQAQQEQIQALEAQQEAVRRQIQVLESQRDQAVLRTPVAARVDQVLIRQGETPVPGQVLVSLVRTDTLEFHTSLPQVLLPRVRIGDTLEVRMDALPGRVFQARVVWIAREPDFTPRTLQTSEDRARLVYPIRLQLLQPDSRLHPGMTGLLWLPEP